MHVTRKMYKEVDVNSALAGGEWSALSSNLFTPITVCIIGWVCSSLLDKELREIFLLLS
jgi:hypothetical protein